MKVLKDTHSHTVYYMAIFFIIFPFALGAIVAIDKFVPWNIAGEPKDWLSFWGTYISGVASFIVIFISIKHHQDLKELQIKIIRKETLNDILDDVHNLNHKFNSDYILNKINNIQDQSCPSQYRCALRDAQNETEWFYIKYHTEINSRNRLEFADYYSAIQLGFSEIKVYLLTMYIIDSIKNNQALSLEQIINELKNRFKEEDEIVYNIFLKRIKSFENKNILDPKLKIKSHFTKEFIKDNNQTYCTIINKGISLIDKQKMKLEEILYLDAK